MTKNDNIYWPQQRAKFIGPIQVIDLWSQHDTEQGPASKRPAIL